MAARCMFAGECMRALVVFANEEKGGQVLLVALHGGQQRATKSSQVQLVDMTFNPIFQN